MTAPSAAEARFASDDQRYEAVRRRDPSAEGCFFTCVRTTGVYCRPTCKGPPPLRQTVLFHLNPDDAERAGFRPCKRCRPRDLPQAQRNARVVEAARALI